MGRKWGIMGGVIAIGIISIGATMVIRGSTQEKVKTVEDYWSETGLGMTDLSEYLADYKCHSSEQDFLSCVNAVGAMAEKLGLSLSTEGGLLQGRSTSSIRVTEKQFLSRFRNLYFKKQSYAFDFESLLKQITQKQKKSSMNESNLAAAGLNAYLSIAEDPHTYLIPANYYQNVISKSDQRTAALGMVLGTKGKGIFVAKVYEGSSAAEMGLEVGDQLVSVNGTSLTNQTWAGTNELLKGAEGQQIRLDVKRGDTHLSFKTTRQNREIPTVSSKLLAGPKPVGVISVNKFSNGVCKRVASALQNLNKQSVKAYLLDLRDNSGGQVEEAACLVGLFTGPQEKVFALRYFDDSNEDIYGTEEAQLTDLPVAVLVNSGSASASEIVAGALQDFKRAILVGERTFGKGTFQEGQIWNRNAKVAKFYTKGFYELPSGVKPQLKGLTPDLEVVSNFRDALREEDLYWNPKRIEGQVGVNAESKFDVTCSEGMLSEVSKDIQIAKAKSTVLCAEGLQKGI